MVDVLKRGKIPGDISHIVACRKCDSRLRFRRLEADMVSDPRDGDYYKITCPVCREMVTLSTSVAETERLYEAKLAIGGAG
jgi:hypothetical protein